MILILPLKNYEQNAERVVLDLMKHLLPIIIPIMLACSSDQEGTSSNQADLINQFIADQKEPVCPHGHKDSIIPIVYGYPSEELFAKSDSGLVALGGCELSDENWYCKIHQTSFK